MPVSLVKLSLVSFGMSTICGLPTIRTLSDLSVPPPPPPPPPPAPAQPARASPATAGSASAIAILLLDLIITVTSGCDAARLELVVVDGCVVRRVRLGRPADRAPRTVVPLWGSGRGGV